MFKGVFKISECTPIVKSLGYRYQVWDGIGHNSFITKKEAYTYIYVRSKQLEKFYNQSRDIFIKLSQYYVERVLAFRITNSNGSQVKSSLQGILDAFNYMTKRYAHADYMPTKLLYIYSEFISIARCLNMPLYERYICEVKCSFTIEYFNPMEIYWAMQREEKERKKQSKNKQFKVKRNENQKVRKCVI